jgi:tetratricopeptide (TPR) repeat protein
MERHVKPVFAGGLALILFSAISVYACIWDSDTLLQEKLKSPKLAEVILGSPPKAPDPKPLLERIQRLKASPRNEDPAWWNDLAGAHLRLGQAQEAADLLAPVVGRFPDDYGLHANLGTAYHLLGRYAEAEKHIARDLEINPDAHFGLEKYHLALLQYLMREEEYQRNHLYVDEFSRSLNHPGTRVFPAQSGLVPVGEKTVPDFERMKRLEDWVRTARGEARKEYETQIEELQKTAYEPPAYRHKWNLAGDPILADGVLYMATLNPKEPACFAMLGIVCLKQRDLNLAAAAFDRAISLGSPQSEALKAKSQGIREHIAKARWHNLPGLLVMITIPLLVALWIVSLVFRTRARKRSLASQAG